MNFDVIKSNKIFNGKVFDVKVDEIRYHESGNLGIREVAIHPGGAVVVPVSKDGKIFLISQYRYPMNETTIELPAGKLEKNEDPLIAAQRELKEETGFSSKDIVKLGKIYTTPGFCNEILHIYLAENLNAGEHAREEGELGMQLIEMSLDEIEEQIYAGKIVDSKTICGVEMFKIYLKKKQKK
ncbi:MAG: NUDIX hydrolase [Ignavibacteriales bacterium CG_4_9_14_3_um_filter_34_10]|nr:MAG: NUDIX hydrolase [Ignavibacteriales bacterium CG_4_9_14_3_um_filter_34_10]